MAIAALILGILALLTMVIPFVGFIAIPMAIAAVILGVIAKKQATEANAPTGLATGGLICGIIALALSVFFTIVCTVCLACTAALSTV